MTGLAERGGAVPGGQAEGAAAERRLARYRGELSGYCYRMLGSAFEADDAVQETLLRAWRSADRFDETRSTLRSWLYTIATNVCLDMLRGRRRRARPMDLGPASWAGTPLGAPLPESAWVEPVPDTRLAPGSSDPAELAVQHETVRLAFVAALQHLPPRQRAVLILREVLCWTAAEVAELLGTTVASVNSALQRARATLEAKRAAPSGTPRPADRAQQDLLARYAEAFERYDVEALVSLLHEDATMSMPPFRWWLRGREEVRRALLGADGTCRGSRLVPVAANGARAFAQYNATGPGGAHEPWALVVVEVSDGRITGTTSFLDAKRLFPLFDLPPHPEL
ncbi:sigma-70 family RNA polymerase sigma factor [Allosalinactinospora lopnorensis]|uniref:sigma-70 family RNA polymerase sigma factor n=1 Tax=Allosalinactinospora lopnorensis TaxID=1352348 RepID=UPI0009E5B12B|nr:sigma-70 family RNA polymerase sigma factor [Allosalinactinospora lopnorensis]